MNEWRCGPKKPPLFSPVWMCVVHVKQETLLQTLNFEIRTAVCDNAILQFRSGAKQPKFSEKNPIPNHIRRAWSARRSVLPLSSSVRSPTSTTMPPRHHRRPWQEFRQSRYPDVEDRLRNWRCATWRLRRLCTVQFPRYSIRGGFVLMRDGDQSVLISIALSRLLAQITMQYLLVSWHTPR